MSELPLFRGSRCQGLGRGDNQNQELCIGTGGWGLGRGEGNQAAFEGMHKHV